MTETTEDDIPEFDVDARIRGIGEVRPWNAPLWRLLDWIAGFVPTYRDTRDGRKKKKQLRVVIVGAGILLMAIGGTAQEWGGFWIVLGILLACLAFVIPVQKLKKRSWHSTLNNKQKPRSKPRWDPGRIECDGRYVSMYAGDDRVRRVRVDRGKHDIEVREWEGRPTLGVLPLGASSDDSIWIQAFGKVDAEVETDETIDDDEMDRPVRVGPSDWEQMWEVLRKTA